jgi:effector-binding domain-containing protein
VNETTKAVAQQRMAISVMLCVVMLCGIFAPWHEARAQISTVPAPSPVQSVPLAPPPGVSTPAETPPAVPVLPVPATPLPPVAPPPLATPSVPPTAAQPPTAIAPAPAVDPNATLAGKPGDPMNVDEINLPTRPALVISGQATWDKGFETLTENFRRLDAEARRLGLNVGGRPLTYFVETDDMGFRFDAILPVDRAPEVGTTGANIRAGQTPQGKALRFTHKGPYEDVDTTYEGITAYLDAKGVIVRDQFIEEYVNEARDAADPNFEINIYVQPR